MGKRGRDHTLKYWQTLDSEGKAARSNSCRL